MNGNQISAQKMNFRLGFCFQVAINSNDIIIISKIVTTSEMFWNYILTSGYLMPTLWTLQGLKTVQTSSSISEVKAEQEVEPNQNFTPSESQILNVTADDLEKAGYNSNKTPWSEEEDLLLKKLRDQQGLEWLEIAERIPGRNSKMCYSRYRRLENHTKEIWRKKDDALIIELVDEYGENWKEISKHFRNRTHKQIKEHYMNYLRSHIKKDDWTLEEDLRLVELLNKHGKNWKLIEDIVENRTQNQLKNRYFGRLKRISDKKEAPKEKKSEAHSQKTL